MQRIFLPNTDFSEILEISEINLYHQLTRVLRARVWQEVIFFDGIDFKDIVYEMIHIDKKSVSFKRKYIRKKSLGLETEMILYQACPNKLSKFETIVQKCCEVWYKKIIFFESERSQKLIVSENKKQRFQKIAIEAIEQCSGNIIPEIEFLQPHISLWEKITWGQEQISQSIICHTQWQGSYWLSELKFSQKINIIVGPEGWFSPKEIENIPAQKVCFWDRILRCETVWEVIWFYISQKNNLI